MCWSGWASGSPSRCWLSAGLLPRRCSRSCTGGAAAPIWTSAGRAGWRSAGPWRSSWAWPPGRSSLSGWPSSAGSTPLRITVSDAPARQLFGKLYARSHLRADRWYELGRELLYGRLEDEKPFSTVRRLVEQEDYALRVMRDAGLPSPTPYGFVELTPDREYLLVTEFFDGAVELGAAEVDDGVIDDGLGIIRKLWHAGLAHRDVKPANLLVRDGQLLLIDVAFAEARPSPGGRRSTWPT